MITVRQLGSADIPRALALMQELAVFEGYFDDFKVTEDDLRRFGLGPERRFTCLVADHPGTGELSGIAVLIQDAWNYQMAPTFALKELFVCRNARGLGLGEALFRECVAYCRAAGGVRLRWIVLAENEAAKYFYTKLGGEAENHWQQWTLPTLSNS